MLVQKRAFIGWNKGTATLSVAAALFVLLCMAPFVSLAASVTATLDRDTVVLGESATLTLTFEGDRPEAVPSITLGQNIRVTSQGTSQQARFENGRFVSTLSLNYSLTPLQPGVYEIPPIQATVRGRTVQSQPLKLTALKGDQRPGAEHQPVFMRLFIPQKVAFIGQAIAVELQVFVQDGVLNAGDILRAFNSYGAAAITAEGCQILRTAHANQRRGQSGAAAYTIATLVTAITPAKAGKLTIESIKVPLTIQLPIPGQRNRGMWDPFGMFQQSQARELMLVAPGETIEALPLPSGAPSGFSGAVGSFSMNASAGPTNVAVGDPITVKVRIEGRGNLEGLALPGQPAWDDFKTYPATSQLETTDPLGLQGARIFEQVVVPQSEQIKALPEFTFSFFDPEKKSYQTLKSPEVPLSVHGGGASPAPSVAMPRTQQKQEEAPPAPDIVPIKRKLGSAEGPGVPMIRKPSFIALQLLPIAALTAAAVWRRRTDAFAANPRLRRRRDVDQAVRKGLVELRQLAAANKSDEFFLLVFRLLQEQIGERLDVPASSITESVIEERLRPKGVPETLLSEIQVVFQQCDQARYAPVRSSQQLEAMVPEVESVIGKVRSLQV
jgi:hypothetical protein